MARKISSFDMASYSHVPSRIRGVDAQAQFVAISASQDGFAASRFLEFGETT